MKVKKKIMPTLIASLIALLCLASTPTIAFGGVANISDVREQIDNVVLDELERARIPNAAIAIIQGEEIQYIFYPSEADVDKYTLFQIGSTSKAFTALGILLLEDEGLLSLDDPVSQHIPWFTVLNSGEEVSGELTIANLLYHTSGFTRNNFPRASAGASLEEAVRMVNGTELAFSPSQKFTYSNPSYSFLG